MLSQGSYYKWILFLLFWGLATFCHAEMVGQLHDTNGHLIKMSDLRNKWVIINYWADWCGGCVEEIPELNRFYQHNRDKNMIILGVNYDQLPAVYLQQLVSRMGISFPVLLEDPRLYWQLGDVTVLPTTFIINPQGDAVKKIIGPNTEQSLLRVVQNRLAMKNKTKKSFIG